MHTVVLSSCVLVGAVLFLTVVSKAESNPLPSREDLINAVDDDGDIRIRNPYFFDLLANIEQDLLARREMLEKILVAIEENRPVTERVAKSSSGSSSLRSGHNLGNVHRAAATDALHEYLQNIFNKG